MAQILAGSGLFAFLLVTAALFMRYPSPLMDDVYITLRHALNFARGQGLVYNPGEHVLAATSPAYALFLSFFHPLVDLAAAAVYSWPVFVAGGALIAYRLIGGGPAGIAGAMLLCAEPTLNPVIGMDTAFFVFWTLLALWSFQTGRLRATAFLLGLMPMVRPDGVFLVAAVSLVWAVENRRSLDRGLLRRNVSLLGWFVLPLAIWCAAAIPYYGTPVPGSLIGKYYQGKLRWWWDDAQTFRHVFAGHFREWRYAPLFILSGAGAALALVRADRVLRVSAIFCLLYLGAYSISHVPAYGNYFFPIFAWMTVLSARAVVTLGGRLATVLPAWRGAGTARAALAAAIAVGAFAAVWRQSTLAILSAPRVDRSHPYVRIAAFLKDHTPPDASVGAMEIGIIGYYSGRRIVDFAGLATRGVARAVAAGDLRFALDHFHPDFVIARYPSPGRLEGGLTARDLRSDFRWVFGADGIGVFQPMGRTQARPIEEQENTVFIVRGSLDGAAMNALNSTLERRGSAISTSWPRDDRPIAGKRFSYVVFEDGKPGVITPVLDASQAELFAQPVRLDFDRPDEKLGAWNQVAVAEPANSLLHVSTKGTDPYLTVPVAPFAPWFMKALRIRVRARAPGPCDGASGGMLWITNFDGRLGRSREGGALSRPRGRRMAGDRRRSVAQPRLERIRDCHRRPLRSRLLPGRAGSRLVPDRVAARPTPERWVRALW